MTGSTAWTLFRAWVRQPTALVAATFLAGLLTACTQTNGTNESAPVTGPITDPSLEISDEARQTQTANLCREGPPQQNNWGRGAAQALIVQGWRQVQLGEHGIALDQFAASMIVGRERPDAYLGMLVAGHLAGYPDPLLETCFKRAEIGMSNVPQLYSDYGRVLEERGNPQKALGHFDKALSLDPNFVAAHIGAGRAHLALGNEAKAAEHAKAVERLTQEQQ